MKSDGEIMEILNAYDLTGSYRAAADLCGCSHHTVKKAVEDRDAGLPPATRRARMIDDWSDVLEGWVVDSKGKIRGDKAHDKLVALGYTGTDRTTRRAVAEIKARWRLGNTRVHRPWITEPGLWLQYDFADGPMVAGRKIVLLVAWLAWSRYRVVVALRDRTAPNVFAGLDCIFRLVRGAATYLLTDNEKTVTTGHIAGVPVRNRAAVTFGRYYGISVLTCEPADPACRGGPAPPAAPATLPSTTRISASTATRFPVITGCGPAPSVNRPSWCWVPVRRYGSKKPPPSAPNASCRRWPTP